MRPRPTALLLAAALLLLAPAASARGDDAAAAPTDVAAVVEGLKSEEAAARLAAAERSLALPDDALTKPLVRLLGDESFDVRVAVIRALAARTTDKARKEASKALCDRLGKLADKEVDAGEAVLVTNAVGDLAQPSSIDALLHDLDDSATEELYRARVLAVADVPDGRAIDELIRLLSSKGRGGGRWAGLKKYVVEALGAATGESLGGDPDVWRAWWRDAKKGFDFDAAARRRADDAERREEREERRKERRRKKGDSE